MQLPKSIFLLSCATPLGVLAGPKPVIDKGTTFTCFDAKNPGFKMGWCANKVITLSEIPGMKQKYFKPVIQANKVGAAEHFNYNCEGKDTNINFCCKNNWKPNPSGSGVVSISESNCETKERIPNNP
ncbi:hypothetical protein PTTG_27731 [Puccinia triticina 1-1 BBBD Race 1]|uniref:Uncharacterized protein n=2 Tax=Puccinia triticina TaxID=208348 RepID=A0A180GHJ8_PUCT1|nr:uncharacterized protein PtA15_3A272 [Puccinia triticina]OAV92160.1 hypothetical protein PTTG_27731 [Puccinia triticina 1-1 BBBD Race 1]WAQ82907.1 hypothetical protein PtA15_3A272 [Puccinia triticina]WAR53734.1 hypothetical protein PtB15_3B243 [Puccinia triticina]